MCTVTWLIPPDSEEEEREEERYDLFFNRDELKTRLPALPPRVHSSPEGGRYIAATDGDHGGTWLFVNGDGLSVGLLNHYEVQADWQSGQGARAQSRGHLVLSMVDCHDAGAVSDKLQSLSLMTFRPFHLIAISPTQAPLAWTWGGGRLATIASPEAGLPFTTSSYDTLGVLKERRARFREARPRKVKDLEAYHRSFDPDHGAQSVCMMRPDAQTWSISHIRVDSRQVRYDYQSRELDQISFNPPISLTLPRS